MCGVDAPISTPSPPSLTITIQTYVQFVICSYIRKENETKIKYVHNAGSSLTVGLIVNINCDQKTVDNFADKIF